MSDTSLVFSSLLSLPSTLPSTTNSHVLNVVRQVESIKKTFMSTTITTAYHVLVEEKFLPKWYILVLATSLVFYSLLSLPSTVLSNTNPHVLNVVRHVESKNNFHVNHHHHSISRPSFNWCDTSWCQVPPWSSPSCCPCRPWCRRQPNLMY